MDPTTMSSMPTHFPAPVLYARPARYKPRTWVYLSNDEPPTPLSFDYFEHDLRPTKRRTTTGFWQCHAGELILLKCVPLDVLCEIFSHLHPLDLLHLAQSSKRLREIVLCRSARYVWKAALSSIEGLPPCPPDLTEPQYVSLAFGEHCHFCPASNVRQVFWTCRVRCCKECINKHFVPEYYIELKSPEFVDIHRRDTIFPYIIYPIPQRNRPGRMLYYRPVAEEYIRELETISCSSTAVVTWIAQKSAEQAARLKHARICERWSFHWEYRGAGEYNFIIILCLSIVLVFLWRDQLADIQLMPPTLFIP